MRYVLAVLVVLALCGGLAGVKVLQISKLMGFGKAMAAAGPPPESVSTAVAKTEQWEGTLNAVGSLAPAKGVTVSSEAAGLVTAIKFESGAPARRGQVLVELDTGVERAQLASALARQELAARNAARARALYKEGAIPGAQLDGDVSADRAAAAEVAALRAQIARKTVRAPFDGRLGIRLVNVGQYLNAGMPVTTAQAAEAIYVDFTLPEQHLPQLATGMTVRVTTDAQREPFVGTIDAIDPTLDPATRAIKVRATLGTRARLRPGMFAQVEIRLGATTPRLIIPATAVVHAAYGDSVFSVEDAAAPARAGAPPPQLARQQFVRVGEARGDFVTVLEGLRAGQTVVSAGAFKLKNGAPVVVHNEVTPAPRLAPHPENR
jgi:membrane fusion protein, multidrug efflux system